MMTLTLKPMLADELPVERMVALADDPRWAFQVKYNGHRVLLEIRNGRIRVIGRNGQASQHNALFRLSPFTTLAAALPDCVLDGELVKGHVWLYDIVLLESTWASITPSDVFSRRSEVLADLFARYDLGSTGRLHLAPTAINHIPKLEMAMECMRTGAEGVIARKLAGVYSMGRRSPAIIKLKFIHDADLVVMGIGFEGRNNVVLGAYQPDGTLVEVGRASANGKGTFAKGDVLLVRYNYMSAGTPEYPNGRLVGPRIMARRTDKAPGECSTAQLVYSPEVPVNDH